VTFLDDDDAYTPERLALGLEAVSEAPLGLCWMRPLDVPAGQEASVRGLAQNENRVLVGDVHDTIVDRQRPHLGQVTLPRELAPRFEERIARGEDMEWWIRASRVGRAWTVPRVGYLLRRHTGPRTTKAEMEPRLAGTRFILEEHAEYFASHPKARAFQWRRLGIIGEEYGDRPLAREAYARSFRAHPQLSTLRRLARSYVPLSTSPRR
jgi:hypothetical protein